MRWARHVPHVGEMINSYEVLVESLKGRDHSEDLGVDGRDILEWTFQKEGGKLWTGCIWLRVGTSSGLF
jgi:hypothetical protein